MNANDLLQLLKTAIVENTDVLPRSGNVKVIEKFLLNESTNYIDYQLTPNETTPVSIGISAVVKIDDEILNTHEFPPFLKQCSVWEKSPLDDKQAYYVLIYSQLLHELTQKEQPIAEYKISLHRFLFHTLKKKDSIIACEKINGHGRHFNRRIVCKLYKINNIEDEEEVRQVKNKCIEIIKAMCSRMTELIEKYKKMRDNNDDPDKLIVKSLRESLLECNSDEKLINSTANDIFNQITNNGSLSENADFTELFLKLPREKREQYYEQVWQGITPSKTSTMSNKKTSNQKSLSIPYSRNRILFGAPGTGKSYVLKQQAEEFFKPENVERVTFHPEYSYFDFVGSYKPKMEGEGEAERIKYRFVPGPFIRILIEALAYPEQDYLLVIEEINRARVAAVFGDVFQLLDRNADGASEYGISPSEELKDHLTKALKEHSKIVDIDKLQIPANLYIWATMNSADQGVYPMDTAFKRRWNFEYQGIDEGREKVSGTHADAWHSLRENINTLLQEAGVNEDKQMGPFFMSPNELNCSAADFLAAFKNKVIMYLFEDAAKHKRDQVFRAKAQGKRYSEVCALCGKDTLNAAAILRDVFGVETANSTSEATQE